MTVEDGVRILQMQHRLRIIKEVQAPRLHLDKGAVCVRIPYYAVIWQDDVPDVNVSRITREDLAPTWVGAVQEKLDRIIRVAPSEKAFLSGTGVGVIVMKLNPAILAVTRRRSGCAAQGKDGIFNRDDRRLDRRRCPVDLEVSCYDQLVLAGVPERVLAGSRTPELDIVSVGV